MISTYGLVLCFPFGKLIYKGFFCYRIEFTNLISWTEHLDKDKACIHSFIHSNYWITSYVVLVSRLGFVYDQSRHNLCFMKFTVLWREKTPTKNISKTIG